MRHHARACARAREREGAISREHETYNESMKRQRRNGEQMNERRHERMEVTIYNTSEGRYAMSLLSSVNIFFFGMRHVGGKGVGCDIFPKAFKVHLL